MESRPPSSLDYSSLLHVLSLQRWVQSVLADDWRQAELAVRKVAESHEPFWKWLGTVDLAITELYRGRSRAALRLLDEAARAFPGRGPLTSLARAVAAHVHLERGEPALALARCEGLKSDTAARDVLFFRTLSEIRLGRMKEAEFPAFCAWRQNHVAGEMALAEGDLARAIEALRRAEAALPAQRSDEASSLSPRVPVWFSLASALFRAGAEDESALWFSRIANAAEDRVDWPIPYARSHYFLGRIHASRGEKEAAEEHKRRFASLWSRADIEPGP